MPPPPPDLTPPGATDGPPDTNGGGVDGGDGECLADLPDHAMGATFVVRPGVHLWGGGEPEEGEPWGPSGPEAVPGVEGCTWDGPRLQRKRSRSRPFHPRLAGGAGGGEG